MAFNLVVASLQPPSPLRTRVIILKHKWPGQQPGLVCQYKAKAFNLGTKSKPLTMVTKALQDGAAELCSLFFTALPPCSVTQHQGLLTAQVSQACLGPLYLCLECPSPTWPAFSHSVLSSGTTSQRLFLTILPPQHSIPFSPSHLFISLTRTRNYLAYYDVVYLSPWVCLIAHCCTPESLSHAWDTAGMLTSIRWTNEWSTCYGGSKSYNMIASYTETGTEPE